MSDSATDENSICDLQRESSLYIAQKAKERDSKYKFLSIMSHELKTPLAGIVGISSMLGSVGPLNERQELYVKKLLDCSLQLMNRINNILDFTKMAAGSLVLQREPLSIKDVIEDSIKMIYCKLEEKGLDLITEIEDIPIVLGDRHRLVQIISNILSNSCKFTDAGKIVIDVSSLIVDVPIKESSIGVYSNRDSSIGISTKDTNQKYKNRKKRKIIFTISDTGIGIPLSDREHVFKDFTQSSNLTSYQSNLGTGLGLSISKELSKMMDGSIRVIDPILGTGTTIQIIIYLDDDISLEADISSIADTRILVVDDRLEMRLLISDILFRWMCPHNTVSSAEEALHFLEKGGNYDIVIVDICMEGMNGIELAQIIRKRYPKLPLIGLSSLDISNGELFFDYYMFKPIDHRELLNAIKGCIDKSDDEAIASCESINILVAGDHDADNRSRLNNLTILIAEDDSTNAFTLKEMLILAGVDVRNIDIVTDGQQCYEKVLKGSYDIVFMDILMPICDGIETTKKINRLKSPPVVIAISASTSRSDKSRCNGVGFSGYMSKPIMKDDVTNILKPFTV